MRKRIVPSAFMLLAAGCLWVHSLTICAAENNETEQGEAISEDGENTQNIENMEDMRNIENMQSMEDMQNLESMEDMRNIEIIQNMENMQNVEDREAMEGGEDIVGREEPTSIAIPVSDAVYSNPYNPYSELKVPSQIVKLGGYYIIADTYRDQIIYAMNLTTPIKEWQVMTSDTKLPHAVAGDGDVYLVADTENNRVLVFEWAYGRFQNTQRLEHIGERPHYMEYDEETDSFFVWSSMTGEMYILKKEPQSGRIYLSEIRRVEELEHFYVRSFTICGDRILFPSGTNGYVIVADKQTFEVLERYPVSPEIAGMAFILPIGNAVYMTVSTDLYGNQDAATMIRADDLTALADGQYEEVYKVFDTSGVPYYINNINGIFYMTNHCGDKQVLRFRSDADTLISEGALF